MKMTMKNFFLLSMAASGSAFVGSPLSAGRRAMGMPTRMFSTSSTGSSGVENATASASTISSSSTVGLNQDKFLQDMNRELPGMSTETDSSIPTAALSTTEQASDKWEEAAMRFSALATKGRALQQKYAVEISQLKEKTVWQDFPERIPLSNAAVWREEGQVEIGATDADGTAKAETAAVSAKVEESSSSSSSPLLATLGGLAVTAGVALAITDPDTLTQLAYKANLNADLIQQIQDSFIAPLQNIQFDMPSFEMPVISMEMPVINMEMPSIDVKLPEVDTSAIQTQVQEIQTQLGDKTAEITDGMISSVQQVQTQLASVTMPTMEMPVINMEMPNIDVKLPEVDMSAIQAQTDSIKDWVAGLGENSNNVLESVTGSVQLLAQNIQSESSSLLQTVGTSSEGMVKMIQDTASTTTTATTTTTIPDMESLLSQ